MKVYQWSLKDGSLRFFSDKVLENFVGGWDSDTGRLFDRKEETIKLGATKEEAQKHFRTLSAPPEVAQ
jgi:hypothetical protein